MGTAAQYCHVYLTIWHITSTVERGCIGRQICLAARVCLGQTITAIKLVDALTIMTAAVAMITSYMYVAALHVLVSICFLINLVPTLIWPVHNEIPIPSQLYHAQTFFFFLGPPKKELRLFMPLVLTLASFLSP